MSRLMPRIFGGPTSSKSAAPAQISAWKQGRENEVAFWVDYLRTKGSEWPDDFVSRLDPELPLQDHLKARLTHVEEGGEVSILDCGAGPFTVVGKRWEGREVKITAVDALADEYDDALRKDGITPPVRTMRAEVERLDELFEPNSFDLVYMRNALDHSYDPIRGLHQMVRVAKVGSVVLLEHYLDEAESARYDGLHQWNLRMEQDGSFVVWNRRGRFVVTELLPSTLMTCEKGVGRWFSVDIRKLAEDPSSRRRGPSFAARRRKSP